MVFSQILLLIAGVAQTPPSLEFSIAPLQKTCTLGDFERHPVWVNCHVTDYGELWTADAVALSAGVARSSGGRDCSIAGMKRPLALAELDAIDEHGSGGEAL